MVRQDKITFLISHFECEGILLSDYTTLDISTLFPNAQQYTDSTLNSSNHGGLPSCKAPVLNNIVNGEIVEKQDSIYYDALICLIRDNLDLLPLNQIISRPFIRIGIYSKTLSLIEASKIIGPVIPVGRHRLLYENMKEFSENICTAFNPLCNDCVFSEFCDYNCNNNDWG